MLALGKSVLKGVSYVSHYAINPYRYKYNCVLCEQDVLACQPRVTVILFTVAK